MKKLYPIGGGALDVAKSATKDLADKLISNMKDLFHDDYYMADRDLAVKYKIKTALVKKIREAAEIKIKEDRIIKVLRTYPTSQMYLESLVVALKGRISYNSLYVLMRNNGIPFMKKNKLN
jgi:hypothetical protein